MPYKDVLPDADLKKCIQYRVYGSNRHGERFPMIEGFATDLNGIQARIVDYRDQYNPCDHVNVDMAFPYRT